VLFSIINYFGIKSKDKVAEKVCGGRVVVILCGGSSSDTIDYCIPRMIERMNKLEEDF
jgi:hypothetical protein